MQPGNYSRVSPLWWIRKIAFSLFLGIVEDNV